MVNSIYHGNRFEDLHAEPLADQTAARYIVPRSR